MKKYGWIQFASIGFCLSVALALGCAPSASAQQDSDQPPSDNPQCTDESLQGRYGYIVSGWVVPLRPVAEVGLAAFDGVGGFTAQDTLARSNTPAIRHVGNGTYCVNANCTGFASIDLTFDPDRNDPNSTVKVDSEHLEFNFMIVPGTHGREFSFIVTNQAITDQALCTAVMPDCTPKPTLPVQTGVAQRIPDEECTVATVQGTYRLHAHGYLLGSGPSASVGIRIVDGAGKLSGHDTVSTNGSIMPRDVLSTYTVNSDCTGKQTWIDGRTFDWVIVASGTQVFFVRTDHPDVMIASGTFKKQSGSDVED
jgi:hypothetical protein